MLHIEFAEQLLDQDCYEQLKDQMKDFIHLFQIEDTQTITLLQKSQNNDCKNIEGFVYFQNFTQALALKSCLSISCFNQHESTRQIELNHKHRISEEQNEVSKGATVWLYCVAGYLVILTISTIYDAYVSVFREKVSPVINPDINRTQDETTIVFEQSSDSSEEEEGKLENSNIYSINNEVKRKSQNRNKKSLRSKRIENEEEFEKSPLKRYWNQRDSISPIKRDSQYKTTNFTIGSMQQSLQKRKPQDMEQSFRESLFLNKSLNSQNKEKKASQEQETVYNPLFEDHDRVNIKNVFSVYRTATKLFRNRITNQNKEEQELMAIDGLKLFTFFWISLYIIAQRQGNRFYPDQQVFYDYVSSYKLLWGFISSGNVGLDNFLYFSAFFQTHKILKFARLANGFSACSVATIYFNRFARLIPLYSVDYLEIFIIQVFLRQQRIRIKELKFVRKVQSD